MKNLLFLGNDGSLVREVLKIKNINLTGIVGDRVTKAEEKCFGSSYVIGKKVRLPIVTQKDFNNECRRYLKTVFKNTDIILIHGYRYKIDKRLLGFKKIKIINFHQSLLPAYAGRHPLNWAIIHGEKSTGISFHYVNEEFDAGDIIMQKKISIAPSDTIITLYKKTIDAGIKCLKDVFCLMGDESFIPKQQEKNARSYFSPRTPEDGRIRATDSHADICNKIRALTYPYPGAFIDLHGRRYIVEGVERIRAKSQHNHIGFVGIVDNRIIVRTKDSLLTVRKTRGNSERVILK